MVTIGWNRVMEEFTMGQWLKGRIQATSSDIAPDGKHWILVQSIAGQRARRAIGNARHGLQLPALHFEEAPWSAERKA
jgi:hypothetical protein